MALLFALCLSACTSLTDFRDDMSERLFGRESNEVPSDLTEFKSTTQAKVLWNTHLGSSEDTDFTPAIDNGFVYAASANGEIVKLKATDGNQIWRIDSGEPLTGGVGIGTNLILLGTAKGYVLAYNFDGKLLWKSKVSSQVLSAPRFDYGVVVVRCEDSRIYGLNGADGARKWVYERASPALTLKSSAGVVLDGGAAYAGFAGGKMIALRVEDGKVIWEVSVAQPKGTTEIERIADITSLPFVDGPLVYAVAYQGKVAAVDRATGRIAWSRDISSYSGLNAEDARIFVSHANSAIYALDYSSGKTFWRQGDLRQRRVTAPLPMGSLIAVGDVEGYVHLLNREDGAFAARVQTEDAAIMPQMVALGTSTVIAQNRKGGIYAISIK
ncbi:MAG: outer membrane protein assembly factor BamB [Methylophilaceae bacterium]|nr:outer membrane protein assembly factor BamB [Methylophilaceae bacterium]